MVLRIALASESDRQTIYALRHDVYARELAQHAENEERELRDALDAGNVYIVAKSGEELAGFISITPPSLGRYSIDKYLRRDEIPFAIDSETFEIRILTVPASHRGTIAATLLMYASLRWVEAHGGTRIMALGRREVREMYVKAGLESCGRSVRSGAVDFALMTATPKAIRDRLECGAGVRRRGRRRHMLLERIERAAEWELTIPFHKPAECFHGGAFFDAIGDEFDHLHRSASIINADVLDAWFPPSLRVVAALEDHLPWLIRTSPPTACEGLVRTIARVRGVDAKCILPGAGSSSLIYLALREWLDASSRVLLPDPTYGEYAHVLEKVIRCRVERLVLSPKNQYRIELDEMFGGQAPRLPGQARAPVLHDHDLVVLVNPNSPTGQHIPRAELESFLMRVPASTLVWIDETYIDYIGAHESLEQFAVTRPNVVICKSMSKVYALSGMRCAYLCASPHLLERLRGITPPWAVGLPAQVAAVAALQDDRYYAARYRETHVLRQQLASALAPMMDVVPGTANFLLCHVENAEEIVQRCRAERLFIRGGFGPRTIRIAVKDKPAIERMAEILARACEPALTYSGSTSR
jgi:histidinol-phosphate/aromatic aminotransferase/cobyric acid decarboxylase-like protein